MDAYDAPFCPVYEAIQILQKRWMLHIIRSLLHGPRGFNELSRDVGGCNPGTLSCRLARLEALGLVTKTVLSVMPPRTTYQLTPAGVALQGVIEAIECWGRTYLTPSCLDADQQLALGRASPGLHLAR
jgi:DNA-binding HxlR family transcriptional regulator